MGAATLGQSATSGLQAQEEPMGIGQRVRRYSPAKFFRCWLVLGMMLVGCVGSLGWAQTRPAPEEDVSAAGEYAGRIVEDVRISGNTMVSTAAILELVRTHVGDKFDPQTVVGDYQRIYDKMKKFADVEARVQPTETGVIVTFLVTEQKQIREIRYEGNF